MSIPGDLRQQIITAANARCEYCQTSSRLNNDGTHIIGKTAVGGATVIALRLNNDQLVEARAIWIGFRWHPPSDRT